MLPISLSTEAGDRARRRRWLVGLVLALLVHLLLMTVNVHWAPNSAPPRVEIQQVDPRKLEAIRRQWHQPQSMLIDKDKNRPSDKEAPKDAKYFSDRNIHVDHEQRAKEHTLIPKPGSPVLGEEAKPAAPSKPAAPPKQPSRSLPSLGNLGVPLPVPKRGEEPRPREQAENDDHPPGSTEIGGEQYIEDKTLPEGSENMLNAQESVYYSFYARLYDAIAPIWESKLRELPNQMHIGQGEYNTVVDVVMDADGNLIEVHQLHGSGFPELDSVVEAAWKRIGRFPNPPTALLNPQGEVHTGWTFTVEIGAGFGSRFLPPERNY